MKTSAPDSKSQVTVEYDDRNQPLRIDTIVISTQHDEFILPNDSSNKAEKEAEKGNAGKDRGRFKEDPFTQS